MSVRWHTTRVLPSPAVLIYDICDSELVLHPRFFQLALIKLANMADSRHGGSSAAGHTYTHNQIRNDKKKKRAQVRVRARTTTTPRPARRRGGGAPLRLACQTRSAPPPPNSPPQAPPTPQPQCSTHTTLHHVPLRRENGAAHNAVQGGAPRGGAHTAPRRSEPADRFVGATLQQALSRANIRY